MAYALDFESNAISGDSWEVLKEAMSNRVSEIRRSTYLCIEDKSKHLFVQDLAGLDASVRALERQVAELRARLKDETDALPQVESLLKACQQQDADLQHLASHLPAHLPSLGTQDQPRQQGSKTQGAQDSGTVAADDVRAGRQRDTSASDTSKAAPAARPKQAPRWYLTEQELNGVAAYMRGRLTLDKVNTAVDELAAFSDANTKLMAMARASGGKLSGAERKRATELLHNVAAKDGIKGKPWFLENDLKDGMSIKLDKTGRSILTLLRHLGRLQEVRCSVEGTSTTAYVLQYAG